jgi:aminoglycoside phosphotransferase (APT) family kinase protein
MRFTQKIFPQATLLKITPLTGGISAQATALDIALPDGSTQKIVVRQHSAIDRARNPNIAADEFRLLQRLTPAGLPVPAPIAYDASCEIFPIPVIVVAFIEGAPEHAPEDLADFLVQCAGMLAAIHQINIANLGFLPEKTMDIEKRSENLDVDLDETHIQQVLAAAMPASSLNPVGLLHGDFWKGNLIWRENRLVGVIDWEDAALGDPLADLAKTRLEMLWAFGMDAMHQLTTAYQSLLPAVNLTHLPFWDLSVALRIIPKFATFAEDAAQEHHLREGIRVFVQQALGHLG